MKNIVVAIIFSLGLMPQIAYTAEQNKPNIIIYLVDDMGPMDMSHTGSLLYETPNIDALATGGIRFTNAYAAHPRCVPSRVGFFSGRTPARYGSPGFPNRKEGKHALPLSAVTFAERLQDAGYKTGYIGKWHLGKEGGGPEHQGFGTSLVAGEWGATPSFYFPYDKAKRGKGKGFPPVDGKDGDYLIDHMNDLAVDYIADNKDNPFLLVMAHYAVHTPIEGREDLVKKYQAKIKDKGIPDGGPRSDEDMVLDTSGYYKTVHNNAGYAAMVESVDTGLGMIKAKLDALDITENTVIIVTSDHGGLSSRGLENKREMATSNEPYRHGKGWLYEGGIRVPLIVSWPARIKANLVNGSQIAGTDHYPTILEMAGLALDEKQHIDGVSYSAALDNVEQKRKSMFFHSPLARPESTGDTTASSLIKGEWKIIRWYDRGVDELYHLPSDIGEKKDLSKVETAKMAEMVRALDKAFVEVGAKLKK